MSDLLKVAQVRRLKESACPACGNEDLFWDKTPVLARDMGHERRAWWPEHSYALDEVGSQSWSAPAAERNSDPRPSTRRPRMRTTMTTANRAGDLLGPRPSSES